MDWTVVAAVAAAYLIGSIDFAVLVARTKGVDIYDVGSGNPGAANVARNLGWGAAVQVLVGDFLKGAIAALLGLLAADATVGFGAGLAAVVGHCFPVWHRFRGGKGVATGGGALAVVAPVVALVLVVIWGALARVGRISSIASLTVVVLSVPAVAVAGHRGWSLLWAGGMMVLIVARHRSNIVRLIRGEEGSLATGSDGAAAADQSE
jgi:glycerol-3-phosphate acyltransferase PlsY